MNNTELKKEIINQLIETIDCKFCEKIGIYDRCNNNTCKMALTSFFEEKIEIKK